MTKIRLDVFTHQVQDQPWGHDWERNVGFAVGDVHVTAWNGQRVVRRNLVQVAPDHYDSTRSWEV
jgi:hypothetical protein